MDEPTTDAAGWEPLEVLAACVLGAVSVLALAGLLGGIVGATGSVLDEGRREFIGAALVDAAGWAPVAEAFLLVALAIVWRQVRHWTPPDDDERVAANAHRRRCRRLATWTWLLLMAAVAAAMAYFVGIVLSGGIPLDSMAWERYIVSGGLVAASLLIAVGGLWVVRDLTNRCWVAEGDRAGDELEADELDGDELEDADQ